MKVHRLQLRLRRGFALLGIAVLSAWTRTTCGAAAAPSLPSPLLLENVLFSVTNQYPPLLAALIERDIAAGRLKSASGPFDFNAFAKLFGTPIGYYETGTGDIGFGSSLAATAALHPS